VAFSEIEVAKIDKAVGGLCRRRTPPELKSKLSLEYRIKGHDVTIFERRPHWDGTPGFTEGGVAKLKFTRSTGKWRLLWQRADLKWHAYETRSSSGDLSQLVSEVDADPWGCFFG
jgi:Protein of unknown function (DUF3024)